MTVSIVESELEAEGQHDESQHHLDRVEPVRLTLANFCIHEGRAKANMGKGYGKGKSEPEHPYCGTKDVTRCCLYEQCANYRSGA